MWSKNRQCDGTIVRRRDDVSISILVHHWRQIKTSGILFEDFGADEGNRCPESVGNPLKLLSRRPKRHRPTALDAKGYATARTAAGLVSRR
jgi:hypothetical protein